MNTKTQNDLYAAFKAFQMGSPISARFAGQDAVTGVAFARGDSIRMLDGRAVSVRVGVEALSLCERVRGQFVALDAVAAPGRYAAVDRYGREALFEVAADGTVVVGVYGHSSPLKDRRSLKGYISSKLRHSVALIRAAD